VLELYDAAEHDRGGALHPFYIVAEKILAPGEQLPDHWAVLGTTGYEFLNSLNGIFIDRQQAGAWTGRTCASSASGLPLPRSSISRSGSSWRHPWPPSSACSGHRLDRLSEKHRSSRDFTLASLTQALREIVANFPVYRTYVGDRGDGPSERDREYIRASGGRRQAPHADHGRLHL
jgi:(1->4)-alpha-D-glucan 1-alpha-D-glucosylmutase